MHYADRPSPNHGDRVFQTNSHARMSVHTTSQRLGEAEMFARNLRGHGEKIVKFHRRGRDAQYRCKGAIIVITHGRTMGREVLAPHLGIAVVSIHDNDIHHYAISNPHVTPRRATFRDPPAELVAENARWCYLVVTVSKSAQIRPANATGLDLHQHVAILEN